MKKKRGLAPPLELWYNIFRKDVLSMGTEKERKDTKMATIYELRLIFTGGEKKTYSSIHNC